MTEKVGIVAVGDVLDINTWSNIPYFFYTTGLENGVFHWGGRFKPEKLKAQRLAWNISRIISGRGAGGFQYSDWFLKYGHSHIPENLEGQTVISFSQHYPSASLVSKRGGRIFYYIDSSLHALFEMESYKISIGEEIKKNALEQERINFEESAGIVTMGSWAASDIKARFPELASKVHTVMPGANFILPPDFQRKSGGKKIGQERPLRLGFIGKDWERKGGPFVVALARELIKKGIPAEVMVIGNLPEAYKKNKIIKYEGFIDKHHSTDKFIELVSSCDFGCLFSKDEALGISVLEFLQLGVPVLGYDHQGMKDTILDGAGLKFDLSDSPFKIAAFVEEVVNSKKYPAFVKKAFEYQEIVSWKRCVSDWKELLNR